MALLGPFPGMDPWLERRWEGVHTNMIVELQRQLNDDLPPHLVARADETVFVAARDPLKRGTLRPDVLIVQPPRHGAAPRTSRSGTMTLAEPIVIHFGNEPVTQGFIKIISAEDESKVITTIEIISPTNKFHSQGRKEYREKRKKYQLAGVSTVEIDLLRGGRSITATPTDLLLDKQITPYSICVCRSWRMDEPEFEYYPIELRSRLPSFGIPLTPDDADAGVDLQAAFDSAYRSGRYEITNYDRLPEPPLSDKDLVWARERITEWRSMIDST